MNTSETKYILGGMCGWSTPKHPWRHVTVLVSGMNRNSMHTETYKLELPEAEAEALLIIYRTTCLLYTSMQSITWNLKKC